MQDLLNTIEESAKSVLESNGITTDISTGQSADISTLPSITIHAQQGDEMPLASGNFMCTVTVECRSNANDTTLATHRTLCTDAFGVLMRDDIATILAAAISNFHVFGINNRSAREDRQDDSWVSTLSMDVYCCLTDLA